MHHHGDLVHRHRLRLVQAPHLFDLFFVEFGGPSALPASGAGGLESGAGAFTDQVAFELRQTSKDVEHERSARGARVDRLGQRPELHSSLIERGHQIHQVLHAPAETVVDWLQCIRQSDEGRMAWDWRPTMADPKHPRHHDEAFKRQIVQSCESGKPSREIRAGYDIARSTPRRRVRGIRDSGSTRAADNRTPGRNEPVEPGRRDLRLEMEVDVSEQAAPVFARRQA